VDAFGYGWALVGREGAMPGKSIAICGGVLGLLVVVVFSLSVRARARTAPDPVLKPEEVTQFSDAVREAQKAELEFEVAQARRDATLAEARRIAACVLAEHGYKPSKFGIKDGKRIEPLESEAGKRDVKYWV
jgi:hypothetical protein